MSAVGAIVAGAARSILDVGWVVAKESDPVLDSESCEDPQPTKTSAAMAKLDAIYFLIELTVPQMKVEARKICCAEGFLPAQACFCYLDSDVGELGRPDRGRDLAICVEHSDSYHETVVL